jgi:hypothetical protein
MTTTYRSVHCHRHLSLSSACFLVLVWQAVDVLRYIELPAPSHKIHLPQSLHLGLIPVIDWYPSIYQVELCSITSLPRCESECQSCLHSIVCTQQLAHALCLVISQPCLSFASHLVNSTTATIVCSQLQQVTMEMNQTSTLGHEKGLLKHGLHASCSWQQLELPLVAKLQAPQLIWLILLLSLTLRPCCPSWPPCRCLHPGHQAVGCPRC